MNVYCRRCHSGCILRPVLVTAKLTLGAEVVTVASAAKRRKIGDDEVYTLKVSVGGFTAIIFIIAGYIGVE